MELSRQLSLELIIQYGTQRLTDLATMILEVVDMNKQNPIGTFAILVVNGQKNVKEPIQINRT